MPEKQAELFNFIRSGKTKITGDEAIEKARAIQGIENAKYFQIDLPKQRGINQKVRASTL